MVNINNRIKELRDKIEEQAERTMAAKEYVHRLRCRLTRLNEGYDEYMMTTCEYEAKRDSLMSGIEMQKDVWMYERTTLLELEDLMEDLLEQKGWTE